MRKKTIRHILGTVLVAALLLPCASCNDTVDEVEVADEAAVSLKLTLRAKPLTSDSETYVPGTEYENYLDIAGGDYRIYFFTNDPDNEDKDGTFIAELKPDNVDVVPIDDDYTEYSVLGKVPDEIVGLTTFKIVILANWEVYPEEADLTAETTTIEDICSPTDKSWGKFTHTDNFTLGKGNLIPFYGVHTYSGVTFKPNEATILDKPITLLRAMAKVEVVFEDADYSFNEVKIHRYNDKGYCAPSGVYTQDAYDSNYEDWNNDFVSELHLVGEGNSNDADAGEKTPLSFSKTKDRIIDADSGKITQDETWIAYVPEYSNAADDYSYIEVVLQGIPYYIYFADYNEETGTTDNTSRYDIERNNLYRFIVSFGEQKLNVHVDKWDDEYKNEFVFGDTGTDD